MTMAFGVALLIAAEVPPPQTPPTTNDQKNVSANYFRDALEPARIARCQTALCWGDHNRYGIEPIAELPVGKTFSIVKGSLADFENSHDISASLAAGIRVWFAYDLISIALYFSKPIISADAKIRLPGSSFEYSTANIRTPYPSIGVGLFGDMIWIGIDYDELHNGDSDTNRDLNYGRNFTVSRAVTITIGLATISTARNSLAKTTQPQPSGQQQSAGPRG